MDEMDQLRRLAGVPSVDSRQEYGGSNISVTGTEKKRIEREKGIEPGTDEWFKLWFSLPGMTGQRTPTFRGRKKK